MWPAASCRFAIAHDHQPHSLLAPGVYDQGLTIVSRYPITNVQIKT